ncbi:MAG: hypothetical protein ACRD98_00210 [Nitrososphaera sp.]
MKLTETFVKYLAGLFDADGTLTFNFSGGACRLHLAFAQVRDRGDHLMPILLRDIGGAVCDIEQRSDKHRPVQLWTLTRRASIEMLVPRLVKHMVIKGKHWARLLDLWRDHRSVVLPDAIVSGLKNEARVSRMNTGPLKPKKHPTWAWVAGYLDGDGCYINHYNKTTTQRSMAVQVQCSEGDRQGADLLHQAFGGTIRTGSDKRYGSTFVKWRRGLGPRDADFAFDFLAKMVSHTHMKRQHIETFIYTLRQRLNRKTPAGEATV